MPNPKRTTEATPHQFSKPERSHISRLRKLLAQTRRGPDWYLAVGQEFEQLYPAREKRRYGAKYMVRLVRELTGKPITKGETEEARRKRESGVASRLYRARNLANAFSATEVRRLTKSPQHGRAALSMRHLFYLSELEPTERANLQHACIQDGWSASQLRDAINRMRGYRRSASGHRVRKPPQQQPLPVVLRDIVILLRRWHTYSKAWLRPSSATFRAPPRDEHRRAIEAEFRRLDVELQGNPSLFEALPQAIAALRKTLEDKKWIVTEAARGKAKSRRT